MTADGLLSDDVAYITGAGRNIGAGIAETFAEHGATVVVNDLDEERAEEVVADLATAHGQSHRALAGDMTDPEAVAAAADTVREEYGGLDVLVNNLGYAVNKDVFETTVEEWYQVLDLTLTSGFLCTKQFGDLLREGEGGAIVNLASRLASVGSTEKVAYCAAKGGVLNMTRQLALDFVEHGVRVNSISPGTVGDPVGKTAGRENFDTSDIPLDRVGDPADVGSVALFLASDLADYVTGTNVPVDGGKSA